MKERVYIETTIPSLYVSRPSPRLIEAARQQLTRLWWDEHRSEFDLVTSQIVLDECGRGELEMAKERIALVEDLPLLDLTQAVTDIATSLVEKQIIPAKAADDAIHIAVASIHHIDYLLTWNCTHLANPRNYTRVIDCLNEFGYRASVICTPEEMIGDES